MSRNSESRAWEAFMKIQSNAFSSGAMCRRIRSGMRGKTAGNLVTLR